jgi:hydrogenase maturation protein HypF
MSLSAAQQFIPTQTAQGQCLRVRGLVQGVGFRPTVWRLASKLELTGHVLNDGDGVLIHLFGIASQINEFIEALMENCPPLAHIDSIEQTSLYENAPHEFSILASNPSKPHTGIIADAASCSVCIENSLNPENRRFQYPFTNCTHCGPRLSITKKIPYDRKNTSMAAFTQCPDCQAEYDNPSDRRFHAQPNACQNCGPTAWIEPTPTTPKETSIQTVADLIKNGAIVAVKGMGGFQLVCDATNQKIVDNLRQRKNRQAKPFALMARNTSIIKRYCLLNEYETTLLQSSAAPIVLLDKKEQLDLATTIAPNQKTLGFLLPSTPLHHLLLQNIDVPVVMTSGNKSSEPQCISNDEAKERLAGIADYWLLNDREVVNRVDDSVTRVIQSKTRILRRSRGYAPSSIQLPKGFEKATDILACGSELKNTFCLIKDGKAILSQHMGDLENAQAYADYEKNQQLYQSLYQHTPSAIVIDAHPEYLSSKYGETKAHKAGLPLIKIQHHHAHLASCLADNNWGLQQGKVLGVILDGLGFGDDNTLWGGEFLLGDYTSYKRLGFFKPTALIGGSQAMRQPWRNTYAQLKSNFDWNELNNQYPHHDLLTALQAKPLQTLNSMIDKKLNTPLTSSCGRLFDAVAAAIGVCYEQIHYEGQAAIELEACITEQIMDNEISNAYHFNLTFDDKSGHSIINSRPLWKSLLSDIHDKQVVSVMSARFHHALINIIVEMVCNLTNSPSHKVTKTVALSGGVFQNNVLLRYTSEQLMTRGYDVLTHTHIPANDGGLCLGQATTALAQLINNNEVQPCA